MTDNEKHKLWTKAIHRTDILRLPTSGIATFGPTNFSYYCLSKLADSSTRIRQGRVLANRPKIILPNQLREIFDGFDPEAKEFGQALIEHLGEKLRALGYQLKHEPQSTETTTQGFEYVVESIKNQIKNETLTGILRSPDDTWGISVMKLTLDVIAKSFPQNVKDIEEHGLFDPEVRLKNRIEVLFLRAERDPQGIPLLAQSLKENGVFEDYEDRFLDLAKKMKSSGA